MIGFETIFASHLCPIASFTKEKKKKKKKRKKEKKEKKKKRKKGDGLLF